MDNVEQKSAEWQMANNPMAIGGDTFADMVDAYNVNPAYVAGYHQAEKDLGWHSVDECLPELDEEVIALTNNVNGKELPVPSCVCFAHRPKGEWCGKNIITGKVTCYEVQTYDAGGWNIPGVKYWMKCPYLEELK